MHWTKEVTKHEPKPKTLNTMKIIDEWIGNFSLSYRHYGSRFFGVSSLSEAYTWNGMWWSSIKSPPPLGFFYVYIIDLQTMVYNFNNIYINNGFIVLCYYIILISDKNNFIS